MITRLKLENFKNFKSADLHLGPLTTLIGSNASGKSNIRDAFRFLHGIGRGYFLAEIIGEKYVEGGVLQWRGIRGGTKEITYRGSETFMLSVEVKLDQLLVGSAESQTAVYTIQVAPDRYGAPGILHEQLQVGTQTIFELPSSATVESVLAAEDRDPRPIEEILAGGPRFYRSNQPFLVQYPEEGRADRRDFKQTVALRTREALQNMRFFDLSPSALRTASFPGQVLLGDRGENLSSLLQRIAQEPRRRQTLIEWIRALTPVDVVDFTFVPDQTGRILVSVVEKGGHKISAYSVSDGTLRFLALLAALLTPDLQGTGKSQLYFFEELETGLHPARLYLLIQLIEQETRDKNVQVVTTTHSPQFLRFLDEQSIEGASLVYRQPEESEGHIRRVVDIPDVDRILESQDLGRLHESGWFEDAMFFLADAPPVPEPER